MAGEYKNALESLREVIGINPGANYWSGRDGICGFLYDGYVILERK